jgi:hypothetical protein
MRFYIIENNEKIYLSISDNNIYSRYCISLLDDDKFTVKDKVYDIKDIQSEISKDLRTFGIIVGGLIGMVCGPIGALIGSVLGYLIEYSKYKKDEKRSNIFNSIK